MTHQPIVIFGEVLWDCFPDGNKVLGGAPFNVAWHLQAFRRSPLLISRVGNDGSGQKILSEMASWGMTTEGMQVDQDQGTGVVTVTLVDGQPQYDIEKPKAYDAIDHSALPALPESPLLYHGSLAVRDSCSEKALKTIINATAPTIFFDVNLRSPWWNQMQIEQFFGTTTWLKLNDEELPALVPSISDRAAQLASLFKRYPLEYILLTEGAAGATLFGKNGDRLNITPEKTNTVVDTVGAGDAFCSILLLGITSGWPLETTLSRAQTFASAIVEIQGATTKDQAFYETFLKQWQ